MPFFELNISRVIRSLLLVILGIALALIFGEATVRIATLNQENYVIEMWRYAKLLKTKSNDPKIGHEHIPLSSATLQNVDISINSFGMRGPEPRQGALHRIAIVGDSMAFGWGVPESDTLRGQLEKKLPNSYDVVNAGIGNMNIAQAVQLWGKYQDKVSADIIIAIITPRATATVTSKPPSWLIKNSQLAAMTSTFVQQLGSGNFGEDALISGYRKQWASEVGKQILTEAFDHLKQISTQRGVRIIIVSIPEMHDFNDYHFDFMQSITRNYSDIYGFSYIDPLPSLQGPPTSSFWVSKRDIHPNRAAFNIISNEIKKAVLNE